MADRNPTKAANGSSKAHRVLVADKISEDGLAILTSSGLTVDVKLGLHPADLLSLVTTTPYSAILVRSETKLTSEVLRAANDLQVVARAGVGVDNIDVETATEKGIIVVNSPTGNVAAAAELTISLMLATARNVVKAGKGMGEGKWERGKLTGIQVKGKTLGIVGLGKVGLHVARIANGLQMRVIATDPYASPSIASKNNVELTDFETVLTTCDFLTLHTPLIASTAGMISADEIGRMKRGSFVVNVARGGLVDETALLSALESGHIRGAAIDVFPEEPIPADSPSARLAAHPNVAATPHLGASTAEAQVQVAVDVCEQVRDVLNGLLPRSPVNAPIILPSEYSRLQPYVKLIERMGDLYTQHFSSSYNEKLELSYIGDIATVTNSSPLYAALVKGLTKRISVGYVNVVNASHIARERGISITETKNAQMTNEGGHSHMVVLRGKNDDVIAGFCVEGEGVIVRLGNFRTSFTPEGLLLLARNYDQPGMIGFVGQIVGKVGVNINFMAVAPRLDSEVKGKSTGEALMICGLDRPVGAEVLKEIQNRSGIMETKVIDMRE